MDISDPASTEREHPDGKYIAGVDDDGLQVSGKSHWSYPFVAVPVPRWIGKRAEGAPDLIASLNRLHEQIVSEDCKGIPVIVLNVEVELLSRLGSINVRSLGPAGDSVGVRRVGHPLRKVDHYAIRAHAPMFIPIYMRRGWNGGDALIER